MQGVNLHQLRSARPHEMRQRLGIGAGGLKPEDNAVKVMQLLSTGYSLPELPKSRAVIRDGEGLHVGPIRTTPVSKMFVFTNVGSHNKMFPIDERTFYLF